MRKSLLLGLALVAASLSAAAPGPVTAQTAEDPLLLKGQSSHPAAANLHLVFQQWAESVEKMSGGRVKIEALPAGAIVPPFEVFDAVSRNVLDVGIAPFGYILGKSLAGIPLSHGPLFGMDGMDYWAWYYDGGGMAAAWRSSTATSSSSISWGSPFPRTTRRVSAGSRSRSRAWMISRA